MIVLRLTFDAQIKTAHAFAGNDSGNRFRGHRSASYWGRRPWNKAAWIYNAAAEEKTRYHHYQAAEAS
jgi:hypothetical protein